MEYTGKTVNEAIELGLKELNLSSNDVEVTILEEPVRGLFGKLKGKAVVNIEKKEGAKNEDETINNGNQKALEFVQKILDILNVNAKANQTTFNDDFAIDIIAEKSQEVIGYRGEVLDAIQTLAGAIANIGKEDYKKVVVNCENYREKRQDTLISLAHKLETKATEMKREVMLEPMNPLERRIIHTALADSQTVTTKSDGKEPNRYVVIIPNEKDEFSKPYNAGRNQTRRFEKGNRNSKNKGNKNFGNKKQYSGSGFSEQRKKSSFSGFGTYLGNSLKNKD